MNLTLSANAPVMSAGVMMANISWYTKCAWAGMFGAHGPGSWPTLVSAAQLKLPKRPPMSPEKAIE